LLFDFLIDILVGKVGVEPTCVQLPFQQLRRQRGYLPMYNKKIKTALDKTLGYLYFMDKTHPLGARKDESGTIGI